MKTTRYSHEQVRRKRGCLRDAWIKATLAKLASPVDQDDDSLRIELGVGESVETRAATDTGSIDIDRAFKQLDLATPALSFSTLKAA